MFQPKPERVSYPPPVAFKPQFSDELINVYEGAVNDCGKLPERDSRSSWGSSLRGGCAICSARRARRCLKDHGDGAGLYRSAFSSSSSRDPRFSQLDLSRRLLLEFPLPVAQFTRVMWGVLRRFIVLLSVLAFVSGMTVQASPSAEALGLTKAIAVANAEPECPRMAMEHPDRGAPKPLPCKGIMPGCVKQMGCLGSPSLPERSDAFDVPISYRMVAYWLPCPALSGQDIEPDLFPPIAG